MSREGLGGREGGGRLVTRPRGAREGGPRGNVSPPVLIFAQVGISDFGLGLCSRLSAGGFCAANVRREGDLCLEGSEGKSQWGERGENRRNMLSSFEIVGEIRFVNSEHNKKYSLSVCFPLCLSVSLLQSFYLAVQLPVFSISLYLKHMVLVVSRALCLHRISSQKCHAI